MKKIGKVVEEGITNLSSLKIRKTIRAVIYENKKVCMLYSGLYDDYTFPGGGLKEDESDEDALKRELKEEIGANALEIIKPLGYVEEIRYGLNENRNIYKQISYYYLCEVDDFNKPKYVGREQNQQLSFVCVSIDEAIKHNENTNKLRNVRDHKGFTTVLKRENLVLNYLKGVIK